MFITVAIGDDKPNIERIYGDAFLDITDLSQLAVKLTAVVKRHMHILKYKICSLLLELQ